MQCEYFILPNSIGIYLLEKAGGDTPQAAKMKAIPQTPNVS
jgi:hypothetical protein